MKSSFTLPCLISICTSANMEELLLSEDSATVGVVTENPELEENTGCGLGDRVDVGQAVGEVGGEQHDEAGTEELSREDLSFVEAEMGISSITSQTSI